MNINDHYNDPVVLRRLLGMQNFLVGQAEGVDFLDLHQDLSKQDIAVIRMLGEMYAFKHSKGHNC